MDYLNIITNVGFPIACVIFMGIYIREITKEHKVEVSALTEKLNQQTLTIQKLVDKIDELLGVVNNENK